MKKSRMKKATFKSLQLMMKKKKKKKIYSFKNTKIYSQAKNFVKNF